MSFAANTSAISNDNCGHICLIIERPFSYTLRNEEKCVHLDGNEIVMGSVHNCYVCNNRLSIKHCWQALAEVTGGYISSLTSIQHIIRKKKNEE